MKSTLTSGLVRQFVVKGIVSMALITTLPIPSAIAQPSLGTFGAEWFSNAASTISKIDLGFAREEKLVATVTAYTSRASETDEDPFISADGKEVYSGLIACSREYPFGTEVIVNGRTYRCGDRMAQKNDHAVNLALARPRFDIWMTDLGDARQWGRKTLPVTVRYTN